MNNTHKHVVVDGQILQTGAWHRGMGKYTLQLLKEMSAHAGENDDVTFYLMVNSELASDPERAKTIKFLCPNVELIDVSLPLPSDKEASKKSYRESLDIQLEKRLQGKKYDFLLTSLFFFDFYAEYPSHAQKSLLFYDLTPMLFWRDLGGYFPPDLYMGRFKQILEAETIYSISETTKSDLVKTFGINPDSITNINGGFSKIADSASRPKSFVVPKHYVLFPTGDLPHKNNDVAVEGFERYVSEHGASIKLLITSRFSQDSKERLLALSDNILFTENVPDEELEWLYRNADAILFASKYEGLGIPILDAVANNKPVITSRISVFEEMSQTAFYYFDPESPEGLAVELHKALTETGFSSRKSAYDDILNRYTWLETYKSLWGRMSLAMEAPMSQDSDSSNGKRKKIAIACLHPGLSGQIGRNAEFLHAGLSERYDIDYYFDANGSYYREMERPTFLDFVAQGTFDISQLTVNAYRKYDAVIFMVDEQALPSRLVQRAIALPGALLCPKHFKAEGIDPGMRVLWRLMQEVQAVLPIEVPVTTKVTEQVTGHLQEVMLQKSPRKILVSRHGSKQTIIRALLKERNDQ